MPSKHALLSASSSNRWIRCPPSAVLCAKAEDTPSVYAEQGTDAHSLCEYKLRHALGLNARDPTENLTYFDSEMDECSDMYVQYVMEQIEVARQTCKDSLALIEQRLDFSKWVPGGFGTGDCVIVADGELAVIDYKYGVGIMVDATDNSQLMCYGLGALSMFDGIYDIDKISLHIFQPRKNNISVYTLSRDELLKWANEVLAPAALLAEKGEGDYSAGNHCQFCKVKAICRKRAEYNLELARYDFAMPSKLNDKEIEIILSKSDSFVSWINEIKEYALKQAIRGKEWNEWKVVEGRSNRKYTDENAVIAAVENIGIDPFERKIMSITSMTKILGKSRFEELLGNFTYKPPGKPTLVPISDKRPSMKNAVNDFKQEEQ